MLSKDSIEKVNDLYLQGWSTRQIADSMGISKSVVGMIVKKSEIGRDKSNSQILGCKRTTRIPFIWSFFPLTPEKTWLLGLIYGDGSLCNDGYKITITSRDFDVIDNINHLFGDRLGISSPTSTYYTIALHSRRLRKELNGNFALVPNKSRILCYPELPEVWLGVSPRWSGEHQHQKKVSGSIPSSWRHGTAHEPAVSAADSRSSFARARSRAALAAAECHSPKPSIL